MNQTIVIFFDNNKTRSIGVSNYEVRHMMELKEYARHPPTINQNEYHPLIGEFRREIKDYLMENNIIFQVIYLFKIINYFQGLYTIGTT